MDYYGNDNGNQNGGYSHDPFASGDGPSFQGSGFQGPNFDGGSPRGKKPRKPLSARQKSTLKVVALCLVCALVGGLAHPVYNAVTGGNGTTIYTGNRTPTKVDTAAVNTEKELTTAEIYAKYVSSCVGITVDIVSTNIFGQTVTGAAAGSGFVITEDGYILTNYHVIEDAYSGGYEIKVVFYNGDSYTAEVKGFDRNNDIAVLKIEAEGLNAAELGTSDSLFVGDTVYAVGNPLGELNYSMTSGMVSATDRLITTEEGTMTMFQFDAAVNQGNSGGPVYNVYGQVVGVVTAKSREDGTEGLGFAIPIDDAVRIANDVISGERSLDAETGDAYLGITPADVDSMAAQYYGFPEGAYVRTVTEGSAAEKAGIKVGDIITQLDGYDIGSSDELRQELLFHSAGETVDIVVWRSGEYLTLSITFDAKPAENTDSGSQGAYQQPVEPSGGWQDGGFYFG